MGLTLVLIVATAVLLVGVGGWCLLTTGPGREAPAGVEGLGPDAEDLLGPDPPVFEPGEPRPPLLSRVAGPLLHDLGEAGRALRARNNPQRYAAETARLEAQLARAGWPHRWTPTEFVGIQELCGIASGLVLFGLLAQALPGMFALLGGALAGTAAGMALPTWYVSLRGWRRSRGAASQAEASSSGVGT